MNTQADGCPHDTIADIALVGGSSAARDPGLGTGPDVLPRPIERLPSPLEGTVSGKRDGREASATKRTVSAGFRS